VLETVFLFLKTKTLAALRWAGEHLTHHAQQKAVELGTETGTTPALGVRADAEPINAMATAASVAAASSTGRKRERKRQQEAEL
jgi:hypothetical protein